MLRCPFCLSAAVSAYSGGVVEDWIFDENLRLFMEALAHFAGATFDDDDWLGLEHDLILRPDQPDQERHTEWPLGRHAVHLAYEPGSSAVSFQIEADAEFELRADTLAFSLQQVVVRPGPQPVAPPDQVEP